VSAESITDERESAGKHRVAETFSPDTSLVDAVAPSPNHNERRGFRRPEYLILHYTGMPSSEAAIALLRDSKAEVSSHYVIEETGRIVQLAPESRRAWHAGRSSWRGITDMNSASIGVEICNAGHEGDLPAYPSPQIRSLVALCRDIALRHTILPERFLAHSDIAPSRKRDPGEKFPWSDLAQAGVGRWEEADAPCATADYSLGQEGPPVRALQTMLALYGYGLHTSGVYDRETEVVVAAFQRHFRPARVNGIADASTVGVLQKLLTPRQPQAVSISK
jgi:N-acetylmuramoyl-L-alanine amidase